LIVEDDPLMSRMYQKIFLLEKREVEVVGDGQQAWEKVHTRKPDIMLLDVMMPKMNGFELLDKMKADPDLKDIPVIMLTNLASDQDAETALLKGAVKYIVKSQYEPKQVVTMVNEILAAYTKNETPSPN
jgi:CheY-like chemotaxis protein